MKIKKLALLSTLALTCSLGIADQAPIRAPLQPPATRKPASGFKMVDSSGRIATLADYRGQVLLLDFWATWCGGCKQEIPWFVDLQETYARKGLAVVGVSLDENGWKVLKPFLAERPIPYRIVLGDDAVAKSYGIQGMPDTFLIDKHGRISAAYRAGIVDRADIEANIKRMLAER